MQVNNTWASNRKKIVANRDQALSAMLEHYKVAQVLKVYFLLI